HAGEVFVWDPGAERQPRPRKLAGHEGCATSVLVTRDGKRAISTGWDGKIRLWDLDTATEVESFSLAPTSDVAWSLAMGPDDRWFLAGTERGLILRFELVR
ncbi:MAG: WD40 repeat domain-containing protein, partial [Planctomycetota bacterium]